MVKHKNAATGGFESSLEPQGKDDATQKTSYGMAVTVTLVFSDEAHREAWLEGQGVVPDVELPLKNPDGTFPLPEDRDDARKIAKRMDYERRQGGSNLTYMVGMLGGRNPTYIP